MKVIVVYESHYGNTAAVAKAIAQGFGPDAQALTTDEAAPTVVADADLVVAGAPVMAFGLPSDKMLATLPGDKKAPSPPDLSHPSMRAWLERLPAGHGASAQFETGLRWSPGGGPEPSPTSWRRPASSDWPRAAASWSRARTVPFARASCSVPSSGGKNSPRR